MTRALRLRLTRLEQATRAQTGPLFVISSIPLPDDPAARAQRIQDGLDSGELILRGRALLTAREMTPEEWMARHSPANALDGDRLVGRVMQCNGGPDKASEFEA